jgi:hypothetical protein
MCFTPEKSPHASGAVGARRVRVVGHCSQGERAFAYV